ncbi:glyoxylase-like metal-dependent hydrolase (beta-lactamase superfamily II) [Spinactinospora alkalitolerans]|uniref:Glyoxylase-like metal-dependent hydrolase (Beta-lactamase superfamily II) n=1 Tax=Spinactinospora alkalitolerans TaxID=687207 RepID=A0A852U5Z6_9ACTN|nr:MBL fold metallo-hydrolase [Spinactinospora alkalitolerans]NYE50922.1 glyoxylase-like metal-dependent hydrolase (beta-lactamase superfamily II) [Spinactinospora alkalitolerans]
MRIDGSGTLRASCVLCPNPGPMTLDGTNTWMLREPGARGVIVVDPGPHDERHLERVARTVQEQGAQVAVTLLTHRHFDHCEGSRYFSELTGAPVRAVAPEQRIGGEGLADGDVIEVDGLEVRVVATPGHTSDSVSFHLPADGVVLTGDTVLGTGTTVIAEDGDLGDYMDSLHRLRGLVRGTEVRALLPGHGPICTEPLVKLTGYIDHREERLAQITDAVAAGARTLPEIVTRVYVGIDEAVLPAARASVRAQLRHLVKRGDVPADVGGE